MANPTQAHEKRSREDLLPDMLKASDWLLADNSRKVKEALSRFNVPYSSFWLFHERRVVSMTNPSHITDAATLQKHGGTGGAWFAEQVQKLHAQGLSWGSIMVRFGDGPFGVGEGAVRKAYERRTNIQTEGLRTGKGGRWFGGVELHEVLYRTAEGDPEGLNRKAEGTEIEHGTELDAKVQQILEQRAQATAEAKAAAKRTPTKRAKSA